MKAEKELSPELTDLLAEPIGFLQAHFKSMKTADDSVKELSTTFEQQVRRLVFKERSDDDGMLDEGETRKTATGM